MRRFAAILLTTVAISAAAPLGGPGSAPEPDGLWMGALPGYTPSTLKGAEVAEVDRAAALAASGEAVLIDVSDEQRKPAGLPPAAIWSPRHRSIPGAVWLPGSGPGDLPERLVEALRARVEALARGDRARPVMVFCQPDCWGSWNVAKRLVTWGYGRVVWFPRGIAGWQESDRPTAVVAPDPRWKAAADAR